MCITLDIRQKDAMPEGFFEAAMAVFKIARCHGDLVSAAHRAQSTSGPNSPRLQPTTSAQDIPVETNEDDEDLQDVEMDAPACDAYLREAGVEASTDLDLAEKRLLVREHKETHPKRART